jgi:hypothetical protein
MPALGVVEFDGDQYLAGKVIKDFFQGECIRQHLVVHPCDGMYQGGSPDKFLTGISAVGVEEFFASTAWRKYNKEENESSQMFSLVDVFCAEVVTVSQDQLVVGPEGMVYRVQAIDTREGGFKGIVASELGLDSITSAVYTASGAYDSATDSLLDGPPLSITCLYERFQTNFRYVEASATKYRPGDRVITIRSADVAAPAAEDRIVVGGVTFRVLSHQLDDSGNCWELHVRRE